MCGQAVHGRERGLRSGIVDPSLGLDLPNPQVVGQVQQLRRNRRQMVKLLCQDSRIPFDGSYPCARVDPTKRAEIAVPNFLAGRAGDFAFEFERAAIGALNELALGDRRLDDGPAVHFSPSLGIPGCIRGGAATVS